MLAMVICMLLEIGATVSTTTTESFTETDLNVTEATIATTEESFSNTTDLIPTSTTPSPYPKFSTSYRYREMETCSCDLQVGYPSIKKISKIDLCNKKENVLGYVFVGSHLWCEVTSDKP